MKSIWQGRQLIQHASTSVSRVVIPIQYTLTWVY